VRDLKKIFSWVTDPSARQSLALAALVFVTLISLYSLTYVGVFYSGDEHLFVSGAQSLGAWGQLNAGQVYSIRGLEPDVEPGQMVLGAILYQFARLHGVGGVHVLFLTNVYLTALTGSVVFVLARQHGYRLGVAAAAALLFGLTTLAWPHSKYYFRDPLATLFVALAAWSFELIFMRRSLRAQIAQWAVTLALVACGALSKNTAMVAGPVLLIVALVRGATDRAERRAAFVGLIVASTGIAVALIVPFTGILSRFSPFTYVNALLNLWREPLNPQFGPAFAGLLISPGKGLFPESPVLLLALSAPLIGAARRDWRKLFVPCLMTLGLTLAVARFKDYLWWGGVGWGVRHMLPAVPLLAVACAPALQAMWETRARWPKLAGGALILASGLVQLGAVTASPIYYYDRISRLGPGAAWTVALWNPLHSEVVGYWQTVLEGHAWDFAWVRLFPYQPVRVGALVAGLIGVLAIALITLWWRLFRAPRRAVTLTVGWLTLVAVSVMPYGLLRVYYPDPYYSAGRSDFRAAAEYVARHARPGDAVVVRGYLHPLWYFFLNYAHSPVPWYAIDAASPDAAQTDAIRAGQSPAQVLDDSTQELFTQVLPAQYTRLWLVNDFGAPAGDLRLEEWWLTQRYPFVRTDILTDPGQVGVSLFALTSFAHSAPQSAAFQFGEAIRLTGYTLAPFAGRSDYQPGDIVPVSLEWEVAQSPAADYTVGVYLLDVAGALHVQQDIAPVDGFYPTSTWRPGKSVIDHHGLLLPDNLPAGEYRLAVALYDWHTGARLPVVGPAGSSPDSLAYLTTIRVSTR
jgi:hypothetical protein